MGKPIRLDKFLTEMKKGSRSQVKELIRKGRVTVDGAACRESDCKVDPEQMEICLDGEPVAYARVEYFMMNKPQGVISATEDPKHRTVLDLLDGISKRKDLFPGGRLDIDTEGLLLLTNDGELAHELLSPKKHVDKVYFARVRGRLMEDIKEQFREGMTLADGTKVRPAELSLERSWEENGEPFSEARLTIREGKFHQVKRMFEAAGGEVVYLKRLSMGPLRLDESLEPGDCRPLTDGEIEELKNRGTEA